MMSHFINKFVSLIWGSPILFGAIVVSIGLFGMAMIRSNYFPTFDNFLEEHVVETYCVIFGSGVMSVFGLWFVRRGNKLQQIYDIQAELFSMALAETPESLFFKELWIKRLNRLGVSNIGLQNAYFKGADLSNVALSGALMQAANLEGCNLTWTIMRDADMRGVNLKDANLTDAVFEGANLIGATVSIEQLRTTGSLYQCKLDPELLEELEQDDSIDNPLNSRIFESWKLHNKSKVHPNQ